MHDVYSDLTVLAKAAAHINEVDAEDNHPVDRQGKRSGLMRKKGKITTKGK